ncbi:uncharacterized protein EV420DRAFT_1647656 [Desarmillaria tabescens]|uniref:F-box domain-containing protein n=1 Tax=Armillaria tabescens TaxID=1929756 RepID=A0AA39JU63_ARMTA|nr:uncharacterized protein EV420DRAFT_1647656 [Desarmillaria tabescens]KAK0447911.1 hypothetical protein EV420DRAFT_1647656 [Desarmillaria tabescens]
MADSLPTELIEIILHDVGFRDTLTLLACSLVTRAWTTPSQIVLLHTITVSKPSTCRNLLQYTAKGELLTRTRSLTIGDSCDLLESRSLDALLAHLPNVKHVTFRSSPAMVPRRVAERLRSHGRLHAATFGSANSNRHLHLLATFSALGPNLRKLRFEGYGTGATEHRPSTPPALATNPIHVDSIEFASGVRNDFRWLDICKAVTIQNLRHLRVPIDSQRDHIELLKLLRQAPVLDNLVLVVNLPPFCHREISFEAAPSVCRAKRVEFHLNDMQDAFLLSLYITALDVTEEICFKLSPGAAVLLGIVDHMVCDDKNVRKLKKYVVVYEGAGSLLRSREMMSAFEQQGVECIVEGCARSSVVVS